ncbi:histidine ammonia-lyase [Paraburkholderia phenoliruptrix]|uniref:Histidine ammonia-lyase n=2 Tax=Paraburkholderia phenoliruptrix TaxID=252970 RepID=K0E3R1_9BURK|nr:histidine ammonia-lyase [Paraburkholderia phenoliruptrix]AFT90499.1 histidine ammonia-lyase [Paraburkholderia phenoliruptrix BR3459a]CAB4053023.1 Histidine ammonia-lyase [Paraburkholderia phenoliruptrix]
MILTPGKVSLAQLRQIARSNVSLELDPASFAAIDASARTVADIVAKGEPAYGINTGFGLLASTHIPRDQLELLQKNLVLSHSVGVGEPMSRPVVRLLIALKLSSLGRGNSGIRREVMEALITLFNADVLPVIPVKGSVGASGDLSPLAHMSAALLGVGDVFAKGERMSARQGLELAGLSPLTLQAKEGLALLNGTQASTALAIYNLFAIEDLYRTALVAGALSVDAAMGSVKPFDSRIHSLRGHQGQIDAAAAYRTLLDNSSINASHVNCNKVQDPYCLRCQPQVMGACLDQIRHATDVLLIEANAVSDNPLIFPETGEVISGGNFHAEPVAFAADNLAIAASEIGALSERRIALLVDATMSGLPPFLVKDGGVNSGFMIAHVTAAALASENKTLAHPASVDSLPTSANQEDHVSMATFAARKLGDIAHNVANILAIELLAAAQGVDLRAPYETSQTLKQVMHAIRRDVPHYDADRYFAPDIEAIADQVLSGAIATYSPLSFASEVNLH